MFDQTGWMVLGAVAVVAALIGFLVGRIGAGSKSRVSGLEAEVARQQNELSGYKREVEAHFDKTAGLFVSMAGSYKELIEHLSSSYHKLGENGSRELFRDRVNNLLVSGINDESERDLEAVAEPVTETAPVPEKSEASTDAESSSDASAGGPTSVPAAPVQDEATDIPVENATSQDEADGAPVSSAEAEPQLDVAKKDG